MGTRSGSIQLFKVFGIRVGVDISWFVILFLAIFWLSGVFKSLLGAGHDTTASLVCNAVMLLAANPAAALRAREEIARELGPGRLPRTVADAARLTYLEAVCKETLRLFPSVAIIAREADCADDLRGFSVPVGTTIWVCPWTLGRSASNWADAKAFRPERFLTAAGEPLAEDPAAWVPFGGGARNCIGAGFAMMEAQLAIGRLLCAVQLELPADGMVPVEAPRITLRPAAVRLRVRRRGA